MKSTQSFGGTKTMRSDGTKYMSVNTGYASCSIERFTRSTEILKPIKPFKAVHGS